MEVYWVKAQLLVVGNETQGFQLSLCQQHTVKGIGMMARKLACLRLLDNVKKTGNSILVTRKGEPIALVIPLSPLPKPEQWLGCMKDRIKISSDIMSPALEEKDSEVLKD